MADRTPAEVCDPCGQGDPLNECPRSQRSCGHHCNHSWSHDTCCWCGVTFGEGGEEIWPDRSPDPPQPEAGT